MKYIYVLIYSLFMFSPLTAGKLRIVASIPDLGDMAEQIGGKNVKVTTLATGREDLHAVPVRPSFLPKLNRADLLLTLGLDAEHAWLPALAAEARNPKIMEGREGWIEVYQGISILDAPEVLDRSKGEQHPEGNPHINIGPQCGIHMAENVFKALADAAPDNREYFRQELQSYTGKVKKIVAGLRENSTALKGIHIIGYHADLAYLCDFYQMKLIGSIEPKAGVSPTASYLRDLEARARAQGVKLIIHNQSQSPKIPRKLGKVLKCPVVEINNAVGASKQVKTWLQLQAYNQQMLVKALKGQP